MLKKRQWSVEWQERKKFHVAIFHHMELFIFRLSGASHNFGNASLWLTDF